MHHRLRHVPQVRARRAWELSGGIFVRLPASCQDGIHLPQLRQQLSGDRVQAFKCAEAGVCAHRWQHHIAHKLGAEPLIAKIELCQAGAAFQRIEDQPLQLHPTGCTARPVSVGCCCVR